MTFTLELKPMSCFRGHAIRLGFGAALGLLLACHTPAAQAQALRSSSASSVAAGPTSNRNSQATPATTGLPGVSAQQSTSTGSGSPPDFSVLGLPVRVAAPVVPAYGGAESYGTFAGQPTRGQDLVAQQSIDGSP
ncbi:hypothetical protein [Lichenicoccus roseus]|uniref:Uncharacterized protein n=1 Tax=Lichenicoccus roseus TaxID=2683649 RepID=A0A5R9JF47_9PROT|nr:hypothetical protein [Lichenicoccus roseus]TLU74036.1 hypothetical protein FE263_02130 [Lichenicoccus roseus]